MPDATELQAAVQRLSDPHAKALVHTKALFDLLSDAQLSIARVASLVNVAAAALGQDTEDCERDAKDVLNAFTWPELDRADTQIRKAIDALQSSIVLGGPAS